MSERKVLNKYYPPDFDPSKIPKLRLPRNRQYSIRIMAPFNMRCNTCGEYIYKGKKFNSRKETVETEDYLGLKIFRFYIKCPRCVAEIAFKTDPQNTDYELEGGATRNFEAMRTAEILAKKEIQEKEQEEANNPMKVLENRTKASQQEMEMIETLEELRDINARNAKVDHEHMVDLHQKYEEQLAKLMEEEDEKLISQLFGKSKDNESVKRLKDDGSDNEEEEEIRPVKKLNTTEKPTDFLTKGSANGSTTTSKKTASWDRSVGSTGSMNTKKALAGLVRPKSSSSSGSNSGNKQSGVAATASGPKPATNNVPASSSSKNTEVKPAAPTGLGLLGAYSDSESGDSSS